MKEFFKLLKFLKGHVGLFVCAVVTMLIAGFFEVFQLSLIVPVFDTIFSGKEITIPNENPPQILRDIIDFFNNADKDKLFPYIIIGFLVVMIIKNVLVFGYQYLMGDVSQRIIKDVRFKLYAHIQNLSLDYFSKSRTGELMSRITNDVRVIENALSYGLTDLFRQTFMLLFWITYAYTIDPKSTLYIFLIFPIIGYPMSRIGSRLKKISKGIQEKMADINSHLLETISGIKLVKAFCNEAHEINSFKDQNQAYYKLSMSSIKRLILISPLTELIAGLIGTAIMWWFGYRVMKGEMSPGVFIIFFACFMQIVSPIKKLGNVNAIMQQALAANERIYSVLDSKPSVQEVERPKDISEMTESIVFRNVDFQYDEDDAIVLKDVSLEIKRGELVAIVGPTGTGKSTLVSLIPRFYDATKGEVLIDGINIKEASFASLRRQIGIEQLFFAPF